MYITDKKIKLWVVSYLRHKYGIDVESNRIYVFKYDYLGMSSPVYSITRYKDYAHNIIIPDNVSADEVDRWGQILSRKEKINKIRKNGSRQRVI